MKKILIVGAGGQIGSELVTYLRGLYGNGNVVAADLRQSERLAADGPFEILDALDAERYAELVRKYGIDSIFNLAALLSAKGEANPTLAWKINIGALTNSLEVARQYNCALFTPSSIGAFGGDFPRDNTPQDTIMQPNTMYGTLPGGGTTDYAVEIYYAAVKGERFVCPVSSNVYMDMMYMPDALRATVELMEADPAKLKHRNSFNIASMSFTPEIIYAEIRKRLPEFEMVYDVDPVKEAIAESWPNKLDDTCAREEWGWKPQWDLSSMTDDMLRAVRAKNL